MIWHVDRTLVGRLNAFVNERSFQRFFVDSMIQKEYDRIVFHREESQTPNNQHSYHGLVLRRAL